MTSEKQIEANRRNAMKSTGPKTQEGKATSRSNAQKHGLLAKRVVVSGEDPDEFERLMRQLELELEPVGYQEQELVVRICAGIWRLRRLLMVEAGIFHDGIQEYEKSQMGNPTLIPLFRLLASRELESSIEGDNAAPARTKSVEPEYTPDEITIKLGVAFISDSENANALSKLSRYETAIERSLTRARQELERLQAIRNEKPDTAPITIDVVANQEIQDTPHGSDAKPDAQDPATTHPQIRHRRRRTEPK